jgi:hypothetical protein
MKTLRKKNTNSPVLVTDNPQDVYAGLRDKAVQGVILQRPLTKEFYAAALSNDKNLSLQLRNLFERHKAGAIISAADYKTELENPVFQRAFADITELGRFHAEVMREFGWKSLAQYFDIRAYEAEEKIGKYPAFHIDSVPMNMIVQYMGGKRSGTRYIPGTLEAKDYTLINNLKYADHELRKNAFNAIVKDYSPQSLKSGDVLFLKGYGRERRKYKERYLVHSAPLHQPGQERFAITYPAVEQSL